MNYTLGSLFDGSGGFPLAGSMCGITPLWAAEVEPYPIAVTRSRFPEMRHLGDISKINGAEIPPVDIITFGSPCQDLSVAGKRAGLKHEDNGDEETTRSGLFMEAVRIIKEMREATHGRYPTFALWENVPGAFSSNRGEDFRLVLEELIKIAEPCATVPPAPKSGWPYADAYMGEGWSLSYRVFDAQYWGVPQRRRRIHLIVDFGGERAREVLFEREGVRGYFAEGRTPWQTASSDAEGSVGADDREGNGVAYGFPLGFRPENVRVYEEAATTLCNGTRPGFTTGVVVASAEADDRAGDGVKEQHLFENHSQDSRYKGPLDVCPMLPAQLGTGGNNQPFVVESKVYESHPMDSRIKELEDGISPTVSRKWHKGAADTPLVCEATIPIHDQATRFSDKRGDKSDGKGNGLGVGNPGDPMNTLTSGDRHAVAYAVTPASFYPQMKAESQCFRTDGVANTIVNGTNPGFQNGVVQPVAYLASGKDAVGTLMANAGTKLWLGNQEAFSGDYHIIEEHDAPKVHYIVRRLTPTECARLQGFADRWGDIEEKADFTDEEWTFWAGVRNTHAAINGKAVKSYTKAQMLTWYNKLHTDSAEYKMWGNGIALPPALYCMQGIEDALSEVHGDG